MLNEFYVDHTEYTPTHNPGLTERTLGVYGLIGLRPVAYQRGHKFYDKDNRSFFTVYRQETLETLPWFFGWRLFWVPTMDEIFRQCNQDGIRVSFWYEGGRYNGTYRTFIYDTKYPRARTAEVVRFSTTDMWFSIAVPVAEAYRRRMRQGFEFISRPLYASSEELTNLAEKLSDISE